MAASSIPPRLYHWTSVSLLSSILQQGLIPMGGRGGHNRNRALVFLQDEEDIELAGAYFNLPEDPVRLTIDTTILLDAWSPDLAAWNDWSGSPEDDVGLNADLHGTLDHPAPLDTLRYTGCICYRHPIPPSAILEAKEVPLPKYLSGL